MVRDWIVKVDGSGQVVVGDSDQPTSCYLVSPETDGSLSVVDRLDPDLPDGAADSDDGQLTGDGGSSFLVCPQPDASQLRTAPSQTPMEAPRVRRPVEPTPIEERGAWTDTSSDPLTYWIAQNRDAHAMFRGRPSGRHPSKA